MTAIEKIRERIEELRQLDGMMFTVGELEKVLILLAKEDDDA